jgi:hypothetical protein
VDVFQELRLRSGRVSNDAHIDVPSMTNHVLVLVLVLVLVVLVSGSGSLVYTV